MYLLRVSVLFPIYKNVWPGQSNYNSRFEKILNNSLWWVVGSGHWAPIINCHHQLINHNRAPCKVQWVQWFKWLRVSTINWVMNYSCQAFLCSIYSWNILQNYIAGLPQILGLNASIITICVLFAIFLPNIGTVLRFSGAACGLAIIFALPILVYLASQRRQEVALGKLNITAHAFIILFGLANFIAQFFIWNQTLSTSHM